MSSIVIAGDTSGTITLSAPAVAGSNTISLPAVTGTILTTAYTGAVTFDGDFTVDTNTLHVDSTNNRVGIGKTNPTTALDVVGTVTATTFAGALTGNVTGDVSGNAGTVTNGVYTTDIGSTVQAYDADLTTLAGLSSADGNFIVGSATGWVVESGATARTSLGLGTAATTASTDYATAAQGTTADSAVQPGDNVSTLTNDSGFITGNQTITLSGDATGSGTTSITVTVVDDSHNHIISNVDGLQTALDAKAPLADPDFTGQVEINNLIELGDATTPGVAVSHTATNNEGIFWHSSNSNYAIYRTSGAWTAPDYQQLTLNWPTGIILNPGSAYGKSYVDVQGDMTLTGTISLADNEKVQFGAGNDLQIYHTGVSSNIQDVGTGNLNISADELVIYNSGATEKKAEFTSNGSVDLYYDNSKKLETTSTGITVTGTVAATAYTGDGSALTGIGGGGFSNMDVITSTGTWTNPGSVTKVKVTVVGAGGGGAHGSPAGGVNGAGGGGGGGTAIEVLTIPTSPVPVTIGAGGQGGNFYPDATCPGASGGTSSFGAYCSATGGGGGYGSPSPFAAGGTGGAGSGGTINITGGVGGYGRPPYLGPTQMVVKGKGGASYFGENQGIGGENIMLKTSPSTGGLPNADAQGQVGSNYGNGGSCNMYGHPGTTPAPERGDGASGVVIVEY